LKEGEFLIASKVVTEAGRVKIVKCLMEDKEDPYYLVQQTGRKKQRT